MKKLMGLGAMLLAGFLVVPGNLGLTGRVYAQEGSKQLTEEQYQELQKKRQEWDDLERKEQSQNSTAERLQRAEKRRQDAEKRRKAAEQGQRELDK